MFCFGNPPKEKNKTWRDNVRSKEQTRNKNDKNGKHVEYKNIPNDQEFRGKLSGGNVFAE